MEGPDMAAAIRLVRRSDGPAAAIVRAEQAPIAHRIIRETTEGLARVTLHVRPTPGATVEARSFVVKRMRADAPVVDEHREKFLPSNDPTHPNYWRREYDVYATNAVDGLPLPLRLPVCYEREIAEGTASLWLEDVAGAPAATWSDDRFYAISRALGAWQGASSERVRANDVAPWFARDSLRMWAPTIGGSAFAAAHRDGVLSSSRARSTLGERGRDRALDVWNHYDETFAALDRTTQTYAHGDFWTRNVLAPHDPRAPIVAIDWSELCIAPLAHDIVNFVLDSVWMFDVPVERLPILERAALDGYADGWQAGTGRDARLEIAFAYRANARLRMGTLAGPLLAQFLETRKHDEIAARYGRSFDEIFETRAAVIRAALSSP
jgi:hypothetical protein